MKKLTVILLIFSAMLACKNQDSAVPDAMGATSNVPYRQVTTIWVTDTGLKVDLREINDSRCPKNVVCIQMGNARLKFLISDPNNEVEVNVAFKGDKRTDFTEFSLGDQKYILTISEVLPYPETSQSPKLEDYRVQLKIDKK